MGSNRGLAVAAFLVICASLPAAAQQAPTGSWAGETSSSVYTGADGVTDGAYLYIAGYQELPGIDDLGARKAQFRRYDPAANAWTTLSVRPTAKTLHGAAYYGGRIFLLAGQPHLGSWTGGIDAYVISTDTWTTLSAALATPRYGCSAAAVGDRIFVTGGVGDSGFCDVNEEFNATSEIVTTRAALPGIVGGHMSCAMPALNRIYVMTGRNSSGVNAGGLAINWEYALPSVSSPGGSWTVRAPLQNSGAQLLPRWGCQGFALNNRVYVTGGYTDTGSSGARSETFEYNPLLDSWAQRASMPWPRAYHAAAAIGAKGYVYSAPGDEFTPPDFGSPPNAPSSVEQIGPRPESSLQAQADPGEPDGWTDENQIVFRAVVTDPDSGQPVRWTVQVKAAENAWSDVGAVTELDSGLVAQGQIQLVYSIPRDGAYDWRWRTRDSLENPYPLGIPADPSGWIEAFGNSNSPDFRKGPLPAFSPSHVASPPVSGGHDAGSRCSSAAGPGPAPAPGLTLAAGLALLAALACGAVIRRPSTIHPS